MKTRRIIAMAILVFGAAPCLATDHEGEILLADLSSLQLNLGGADYYHWLTPEKGRVVLNRPCVPMTEDCDHEVLVVWDEGGQQVFEQAPFLDIPEISHATIFDSTLAAPDRLIVSTAVGGRTSTWVLAEYDVNKGKLLRVIRTGPIRCRNVLGDQDGTIWCLGIDVVKRKKEEDFDLVYLFDGAGNLLGSSLPRSAFSETPGPLSILERPDGYGGFLPGDGKIRLWLPAVEELITFDVDGRVLDRLTLPTVKDLLQARLVTAPDNEVYAVLTSGTDARNSDSWTHGLFRLTHNGALWTPLEDPPVHLPLRITLSGADDEGLILLDRKSLTLLWYPVATDSAIAEMADPSITDSVQ